MKIIFTVVFLAVTSVILAQNESLMQDAITKPALSLRCKELHKERSEKVKFKQKLNALLERNNSITKKTPRVGESMRARLESNRVRVKNELHLTNLQIETMEENIVRSGCPGISL